MFININRRYHEDFIIKTLCNDFAWPTALFYEIGNTMEIRTRRGKVS